MAYSFNGSLKTKSLKNHFLEQFANISKYRQLRDYTDIAKDMQVLWDIDKVLACKFVLYMRMITRQTNVMSKDCKNIIKLPTQTGAGLKHEAINRIYWVGDNHRKEFERLLPLFISVGSWKDFFQLWRIDIFKNNITSLDYKGRSLNWGYFMAIIKACINDNLLLKYLPAYVCSKKKNY